MQQWLAQRVATTSPAMWERLAALTESDGSAEAAGQPAAMLHGLTDLVSPETLATAGAGVNRGMALLSDARFIASLRGVYGERPAWWVSVLLYGSGGTPQMVPPLHAVQLLRAVIRILTNIITIKWYVVFSCSFECAFLHS